MTTTALPQTKIDSSDYPQIIARLEGEITKRRWKIGTVAIDAVESGTSITKLAQDTRIARSTLDSYYQNTKFYPEEQRDFLMEYEGFTWSILKNTREFIMSDHNTQWRKDIYGALSFFNHCAKTGSVTADQVRMEIQIAKGKPKTRKRLADHVLVMVSYDRFAERHYIELPQGEKLPPEIGVGLHEIDIYEVQHGLD